MEGHPLPINLDWSSLRLAPRAAATGRKIMTTTRRLALAGALSTMLFAAPGLAQDKIRIAFGDIPSVETLHFLIGIERAKEKGVQIEFTSVKSEDIAAQAV